MKIYSLRSPLRLWQKKPNIVCVCAWCPPDSYPPLKPGEAYSHGICAFHRIEMIFRVHSKKRGYTLILSEKDPEARVF